MSVEQLREKFNWLTLDECRAKVEKATATLYDGRSMGEAHHGCFALKGTGLVIYLLRLKDDYGKDALCVSARTLDGEATSNYLKECIETGKVIPQDAITDFITICEIAVQSLMPDTLLIEVHHPCFCNEGKDVKFYYEDPGQIVFDKRPV